MSTLPFSKIDESIPEFFSPYRYHSYNQWVKKHHGVRVQKVSLDAGFTCPNRDGSRATGGCTFCNNRSFTPSYLFNIKDVQEQLETGLEFLKRRYGRSTRFIAYFQPYSNTYASIDFLRSLYESVLAHPDIDGIAIGTRPDCLPDDILDYLATLSKKYIVELEMGIESCNENVLTLCNRGHSFLETEDALLRTKERELFVTGHMLFGLPGETHSTIIEGIKKLAQLPIQSLKFHQLQVVKGSQLANTWRNNPIDVPLLGFDEYLNWVVDVLELLPAEIKIQRLSSDVPEDLRVEKARGERIENMSAKLNALMQARDTWQGRFYNKD